jgi:hypothetical protein
VIRYINCFKKAQGLSAETFREYWQSAEFEDLIREVAQLTEAASYARNLTLQVSMGENLINERGLAEPYDGIVEYYWENAQHLPEVYRSEAALALFQRMQDYQSNFIDLANSTAFFTESGT